ncbi:MAG: sigma 54-interacting transcriptional regulator [Candidatus Competibacteraceae bacterium]|nr:sigma 54-interacting transcriptional regulator [Candidatus Competibacteraceae bacterium]
MVETLERDGALDQALRSILEGTAAHTGGAFFQALVRELAGALGVKYAFVADLSEDKRQVRTLAYWSDGRIVDNIEYPLAGTPCEVVARGEKVYYTREVWKTFPASPELEQLGIESYFGVPLVAEDGEELGHLAVYHDAPLTREFRGMALLEIFAARARAELERKRAEGLLADSRRRLGAILCSALDAIITVDDRLTISLFNPAARRIFRLDGQEVEGHPLEGLLSDELHILLQRHLADDQPRQLWAPQGLTARRADGSEFPVEATFSPFELGGRRYHTLILRDITERQAAEAELARLRQERVYLHRQAWEEGRLPRVIGQAPAMKRVLAYVEQVAATDSTVLLTGETGTGKEVVAQAIHDLSPRHERMMVKMNCAALPADLVESELFGHEKGAFTGATSRRKGRFELADGGTIFLDEVGELPAAAQAKLLRILQEQAFERVGGSQVIKVDVRVVAATNRNLAQMVRDGGFRSDLYYRLNVFPIQLPSLRQRREDIPLLARHFLDKYAQRMDRPVADLAESALERLVRYPWPGNVRELQNVIERAVILARGPWLEVDDALDLRLEEPLEVEDDEPPAQGTLEEVERAYILRVLGDCGWRIEGEGGAAGVLGLKPSTLRSRMHKLGVRKPQAA